MVKLKYYEKTISYSSFFSSATPGFSAPKADLEDKELETREIDPQMTVGKFNLGIKYLKGIDTEPSPGIAFTLFKQAADLGYHRAQYQVGMMYHRGIGVEQDFKEAIKLFRRSG